MVASTKKWFDSIVVGQKLCPFAPPLQAANTLRIVASAAKTETDVIAYLESEVNLLMVQEEEGDEESLQHETTLVALNGEAPFCKDFRDFVRFSWTLQEDVIIKSGFQDELQLVLFHPTATHQTYSDTAGEEDSAADYTIRSPFPTVHLLREQDVMRAVKGGYPNLESLSARNKEKLTAQGLDVCKARLEECRVVD